MTTCQQDPFVGVTAAVVDGRTLVTYPNGRVVDATCSPWGERDDGMQLVPLDNVLWLWDAALVSPTQWIIIGRPVGDPACLRFHATPVPGWRIWLGMHANFGRVWYLEVGGVTDQEPIDQLRTVFPIPPAASFSLDTTSGQVPLTVTARLTSANLTTWRWLLDGAIDQPIDGQTHAFTITTPGTHSIGLRTNPVVTVPERFVSALPAPVVVTPPKPNPAFQIGCQSVFNCEPVPEAVWATLAQKGWQVQRLSINHLHPTKDAILGRIDDVHRNGLTPLTLMPIYATIDGQRTRLVDWIPEGEHIELYGLEPDTTKMGAEQDLLNNGRGGPAEEIAREIDALMPMFRAKRQIIYAGCVSNFSRPALAWLKRFVDALQAQDVVITIHRYPDYGTRTSADPRKEWKYREEEYRALKAVIGDRPWACTESGWRVGKYWKRQGDVWKALDKIWPGFNSYTLDRQQCAANCLGDARWVRDHGGLMYVWFQAWEGTDPDSGLRDIHDVWQPASDTPSKL